MIFVIYFSMIITQWIFSYFNLWFLKPDIIFIYVFIITYYKSTNTALIFSFFAGIFADFYYTLPLGTHCLVFNLFSFFVSRIKHKLDISSIIARVVNFLISNYIVTFLSYLIVFFVSKKNIYSSFDMIQPIVSVIFMEVFVNIWKNLQGRRMNYVRL